MKRGEHFNSNPQRAVTPVSGEMDRRPGVPRIAVARSSAPMETAADPARRRLRHSLRYITPGLR